MKKTLLLILMLAFIPACAMSAGYDPGLTLRAVPKFSFSEGDVARTQLEIKTDIDILALRIGRGTVSLPLSISYTSKSPVYGGLRLNSYASFAAGLAYRHRFTELFSMRFSAYAALRYFNEINAATGIVGLSASPMLAPLSSFAVSIPLEVEFNAKQTDFSAGVAFSFFFSGGTR